jgi:serine/threonine-protein kinase HipA
LFRLLVFIWWTANGDMHLKNFSLLRGEDGNQRLSPAYDLLCTRLVIEDDPLALPIGGNKADIRRREWLELARRCGLNARVAERTLGEIASSVEDAVALIARSALSQEMQAAYAALLRERSLMLGS